MIEIIEGGKRHKANNILAGVGGGGRNAVTRMINDNVSNVHFVRIDTKEKNPDDKAESYLMLSRGNWWRKRRLRIRI